jgi:hypothetical protein
LPYPGAVSNADDANSSGVGMNTNALSIIDAAQKTLVNKVLLDDVDLGAANPGRSMHRGRKYVCVSHPGTHGTECHRIAPVYMRNSTKWRRVRNSPRSL